MNPMLALGIALGQFHHGVIIPHGRPCWSRKCPQCGKKLTGRIALSQHLQDKHDLSKRESKGCTP